MVEAKLGSRTLRQRMIASARVTEAFHKLYWQRFEVNTPADGHASIGWQTSLDASNFLLDQVSTLWGLLAYRNKILDPTLQVSDFHNNFCYFLIFCPLNITGLTLHESYHHYTGPLWVRALHFVLFPQVIVRYGRYVYVLWIWVGPSVGFIFGRGDKWVRPKPGRAHWRRMSRVVIIPGQPPMPLHSVKGLTHGRTQRGHCFMSCVSIQPGRLWARPLARHLVYTTISGL